jgi:ribonuclease Y
MGWWWLLMGGALGAGLSRLGSAPQEKAAPPEDTSRPAPTPTPTPDLELLASMTREEALQRLLDEVRVKKRQQIEAVERHEWEALAARKISDCMRSVVLHQAASGVATVELPADEFKGRIIGKEGRNLRQFELLTGVDLIIDDRPGCVSLSSFDPERREVARMALQQLCQEGRFSSTKMEEAVRMARQNLAAALLERARQAARQARISGLSDALLADLSRLALRTSYRQNVLEHSVEVAWLAHQLAVELGADPELARRAGLLHDIGKGCSEPGPHALVGAQLCRRGGESEAVVHCVESHHEEVPQQRLEATLVQVADAISAARPGARQENAHQYLERMQRLEALARDLEGVEECQVVQAGREVRVFVRPEVVDDEGCMRMAQRLADQIEEQLQGSPPVRVTVVRHLEASARSR